MPIAQTFPNGFYRLIGAQFLSATADNALLLIAISLAIHQGIEAWWIPLLKATYVIAYVVLAPWAGALSDRFPKPMMMTLSHMFKLLGSGLLLVTDDPRLGFALVGAGAALYSPAKYGWITEGTTPSLLVKANGWIETTSVAAAVLGLSWGGLLISDACKLIWVQLGVVNAQNQALRYSVIPILLMYTLTIILMIKIPVLRSNSIPSAIGSHPLKSRIWHFFRDQGALWKDPLARVSLLITSLFWGVGACLQLLVLEWGQTNLGLSLSQSAYLQGISAIGLVGGALLAGQRVQLNGAIQLIPIGLLIGCLMPLMNWIDGIAVGVAFSFALGAISGIFVVPMNALLQHRGQQLVSAGRSIAIQNFNENTSILLVMLIHSTLIQMGWAIDELIIAIGIWVTVPMAIILLHARSLSRQKRLIVEV